MLVVHGRDWKLVGVSRGMFEFEGLKVGESRCIMLADTAKYVASNTICFWLGQEVNGTDRLPTAKLTYDTARRLSRGQVSLPELSQTLGVMGELGIDTDHITSEISRLVQVGAIPMNGGKADYDDAATSRPAFIRVEATSLLGDADSQHRKVTRSGRRGSRTQNTIPG